jgi:hypothetical protein
MGVRSDRTWGYAVADFRDMGYSGPVYPLLSGDLGIAEPVTAFFTAFYRILQSGLGWL